MVLLSEVFEGSSPSTSTHDQSLRYDVFLSFRGADTRNNFTDHLYHALNDANLKTFLDDEEIETGEDLKPELEDAIRASRCSIVVLSENYASSTWCLEELVLILHQKRTSNHIVFPVFFHVEPTNVRNQQRSFGDAIAKHKQRMKAEANVEEKNRLDGKMKTWKEALTKVADLKGKDAKGRKETELIKEIVKEIYSLLRAPLGNATPPPLFGMDYSIEFVASWLKGGSSHTANILTIRGMGGIGKTCLARYVYELHRSEFDRNSFIEDISRRFDKFNGFLDLQKQILGDLISTKCLIQDRSVSEYTSMIENAMANRKVFLVLDDVDNFEQLDALLGKKGLHPGSKILVTTKDASLTERCALFKVEVKPTHTEHFLRGLYGDAPLELLCHHAFTTKHPKEGYEEVSKKLAKYCEGHPLALEVLGKSLYNRDVDEWEDNIEKLKKEPNSRIKKALQMSFNSLLFENDKELFKHIACFFVGIQKGYTETILNACDINTTSGIANLIDRCLLSIGWNDTLNMHQLVQEMGRDVVRQESPGKPWERSRLWCHKETIKFLKQKKDMENLLGLALDMRMLEKEDRPCASFELETDSFSKMDNLMLLQLNYVHLNGSYKNFPQDLRWLCMHGFPSKSILLDLPLRNLVALDMSYSNIQSFNISSYSRLLGKQYRHLIGSSSKYERMLGSLKILDLSFCEQLHSLGGFFELPALERLIVGKCIGLVEVCESIEHCVELVFIDLSGCIKLEKLPRNLGKLNKVETFLLDGCNLSELIPIEMKDMDSLEMLKAKNISISNDLKLSAIFLPSSLVRLSLTNNNLSNESFPMDFSGMSMLKGLFLDGNPIVSMPNCVRSLPRLEMLSMNDCKTLKSIEHPPCTLRWLSFCPWRHDNEMSLLRRIVFDREMSPLYLEFGFGTLAPSSFEIEGMVKIQPIAGVEGNVLRSLGWTHLGLHEKSSLGTCQNITGEETESQIKMYYEFGIFSTVYGVEVMPEWIGHRWKRSSSFTIPPSSSPNINKLRGLNIYCVTESSYKPHKIRMSVPLIKISNITKKRSWIYQHYTNDKGVFLGGSKSSIYVSHWMIGKNEMEGGDYITITILNRTYMKKCEYGFSLVYDDDDGGEEEEEDVLGYYKSWNHIIGGGDLSPFQTTYTGGEEYFLDNERFFEPYTDGLYRSVSFRYKEKGRLFFRALSQRKSD